MNGIEIEFLDYWDQKILQMGGMRWNYSWWNVMKGMVNGMINIEYTQENVLLWKRYDKRVRPENNPDGRDVIELELRSCNEGNDKWWMNIEYTLNDSWLWKRDDKQLRPENNPDGRDVIELE